MKDSRIKKYLPEVLEYLADGMPRYGTEIAEHLQLSTPANISTIMLDIKQHLRLERAEQRIGVNRRGRRKVWWVELDKG